MIDIDNWVSNEFDEIFKKYNSTISYSDKDAYIAYIKGNLFKSVNGKSVFIKKKDLFKAIKQSLLFRMIRVNFLHEFYNKNTNKIDFELVKKCDKKANETTHDIFNKLIADKIIIIKNINRYV